MLQGYQMSTSIFVFFILNFSINLVLSATHLLLQLRNLTDGVIQSVKKLHESYNHAEKSKKIFASSATLQKQEIDIYLLIYLFIQLFFHSFIQSVIWKDKEMDPYFVTLLFPTVSSFYTKLSCRSLCFIFVVQILELYQSSNLTTSRKANLLFIWKLFHILLHKSPMSFCFHLVVKPEVQMCHI